MAVSEWIGPSAEYKGDSESKSHRLITLSRSSWKYDRSSRSRSISSFIRRSCPSNCTAHANQRIYPSKYLQYLIIAYFNAHTVPRAGSVVFKPAPSTAIRLRPARRSPRPTWPISASSATYPWEAASISEYLAVQRPQRRRGQIIRVAQRKSLHQRPTGRVDLS